MGGYSIIYADPSWRFETYSARGQGRSPERHYPCLPLNAICRLPVGELAAGDAVLFLWATFPLLPQALRVVEAWGVAFKTVAFTWVKRNRRAGGWFWGLGHWTRQNAEVCLLATWGRPARVAGRALGGGGAGGAAQREVRRAAGTDRGAVRGGAAGGARRAGGGARLGRLGQRGGERDQPGTARPDRPARLVRPAAGRPV